MKPYRVQAHRDGNWWALEFPDVDDRIHSQCRRLAQAAEIAAEAISFSLGDDVSADDVAIEPVLSDELAAEIEEAVRLRAEAEQVGARASQAVRDVAKDLTGAGLPVRDAATLLGVSHQYVARVAKG